MACARISEEGDIICTFAFSLSCCGGRFTYICGLRPSAGAQVCQYSLDVGIAEKPTVPPQLPGDDNYQSDFGRAEDIVHSGDTPRPWTSELLGSPSRGEETWDTHVESLGE